MKIDYAARQARLHAIEDVDAVLLVPGTNMVYFTGLHYHLSERPIIAVFMKDSLSFIIPELEVPKLNERPDLEARAFVWTDAQWFSGAFKQAVKELGLDQMRIGADGMTMRLFEAQALEDAGVRTRVTDLGQTLLNIRAIKSQDEIEAMRKACQISEEALRKTIAWVQPGMTEAAIATRLGEELVSAGSAGNSFAPLVLIGERSALPHGNSGERRLGQDELLLIDYGGTYHDYPADITRTFCLGDPGDELRKIYDIVLRANEAAIKAAGPGVPCGDVDKAAREVIMQAGYGEYFIHRTGHGLGLDVHELPQMAAGNSAPLRPGMVFTVEPGIYIPGVGGVRIEDNVAVTETGVDVLTSYPKQSLSR